MHVKVIDKPHSNLFAIVTRNPPLLQSNQRIKIILDDSILFVERGIVRSDVVGIFSELDRIENAEVFDLIVGYPIVESKAGFFFVGFYATDEMDICVCGHLCDQFFDLFSYFYAQKTLIWFLFDSLVFFLECVSDKFDPNIWQPQQKILSNQIFIFLPETVDHVLDVSRGVFDDERFAGVY